MFSSQQKERTKRKLSDLCVFFLSARSICQHGMWRPLEGMKKVKEIKSNKSDYKLIKCELKMAFSKSLFSSCSFAILHFNFSSLFPLTPLKSVLWTFLLVNYTKLFLDSKQIGEHWTRWKFRCLLSLIFQVEFQHKTNIKICWINFSEFRKIVASKKFTNFATTFEKSFRFFSLKN